MPAWIYPLSIAIDKDFCDAARSIGVLPANLKLVGVIGIHDGGETVKLDFSPGKLKFDQLATTFRKLRRSIKDRLAV